MPPKLTPDEKKALKAEKKAEKKLKAIERKKQLKRDKLAREIEYSNLTLRRHEKDWRQMLINISLPAMRNDLEFAWHNFERVIDCKDFTISMLLDEIRNAEEQYLRNYRNHLENINKLIDLFDERMGELQIENERQISEIRQHFEEEFENEKHDFEEDENYLKTIIYILEVAKKTQKQNVRAEYFSKLEEEDTKNVQLIQRVKDILESGQFTIQTEIQDFVKSYKNQVKERKKQHDDLQIHDEALQKLLTDQLEKIRHAYEDIKRLKQKLSDSQKILGRREKDLEVEYQFFNVAFNTLKKKLIKDRKKDELKMMTLTVTYNETLQFLEKLKEKGKQILNVAAVCRKLETQEEKILPFPVINMKDVAKPQMDNVKGYVPQLEFFWQRLGQADASRYAVNEEREFLKTANELLKFKVHKYCQCLKRSGVITHSAAGSKYVTEGALEQKKYEMQDFDQFATRSLFSESDFD
ncbi:dynein regulatory complex subunit 2 [Leptinotarsa decemlineata]|uniref:dynein regulatory complex subunit 2 n=1 Tax=Leptinotarsa decemlineata TaxID=7539 RepID=UPI003D305123